jgi:hypothetical protein
MCVALGSSDFGVKRRGASSVETSAPEVSNKDVRRRGVRISRDDGTLVA